jgi:aminopeptidase
MKTDISGKLLGRWADILLKKSLKGIVPGDMVHIRGEAVAWPLIAVLQEKILCAGGMADICITAPDNERGKVWSTAVARFGRMSNLARIPDWQRQRVLAATKSIQILGMSNPEYSHAVVGERMQRIMTLDLELRQILRGKPWVITMYPTPAFAAIEKRPYRRYRDAVVAGSVQPLERMEALAEKLVRRLDKSARLTVVTRAPGTARDLELSLSLEKSAAIKGTEGSNIPDGEVYTSPDASSVEGEVFLDMPRSSQGDIIDGVYLKFRRGRVVAYRAAKGARALRNIITTDKSSCRLGEVAFGINTGMKLPLMHPLFCEKLAGTMHFALGNSFPDGYKAVRAAKGSKAVYNKLVRSGAANVSAQHVDLVVSFRKGGAGRAVYLDGSMLKLKNGNWAP